MDSKPVDSAVGQVIDAVLSSRKYQWIASDLVRSIAMVELGKGRSLKAAIKATKNQLHQSAAAYQPGRMDYSTWLADLERIYLEGNTEACRQQLRLIMAHHTSTAERIPILESFYSEIFTHLPPPQSIIDVACGLNPLAYTWMPLPPTVDYYACDIYSDQVGFLDKFFRLTGIQGTAEARDVVQDPPVQSVDLVLLLKTIPCLEQIDRTAGMRLLNVLNAHYLLISFPVRSLSGRPKGMVETYEAHFEELIDGRNWTAMRFDFDGELAFLVKTR